MTRYLYKIALKNLLQLNKPSVHFMELYVNIFIKQQNANAWSDVQYNQIQEQQVLERTREVNFSKVNGVEMMSDLYFRYHYLALFHKESHDLRHRVCKDNLSSIIGKLMDLHKRVYKFEIDSMDSQDEMSSKNLEEQISHLKFMNIFTSLMAGNPILQALEKSKKVVPYIKHSNEDTIQEQTSKALIMFLQIKEPTFLAQHCDSLISETDDRLIIRRTYSSFPNIGVADLFHRLLKLKINLYEDQLRNIMRKHATPLFTPNSPAFKPQSIEELIPVVIEAGLSILEVPVVGEVNENESWYEKGANLWDSEFFANEILINERRKKDSRIDAPLKIIRKIRIKHRYYEILRVLMGETKNLGLTKIKWVDIVSLFGELGGSVVTKTGSINKIYIGNLPFAMETRFDRPHPGIELGYSAFFMRAILSGWGLDIDNYTSVIE